MNITINKLTKKIFVNIIKILLICFVFYACNNTKNSLPVSNQTPKFTVFDSLMADTSNFFL